jgi:glycosyltransferase involved in cell wall biosynthesis
MNILFIRQYPAVDGTFTMLLRMAEYLKKDGHTAWFLSFGIKTDMEAAINETFSIISFEQLNTKQHLPPIDVIHPIADGELLTWICTHLKPAVFPNAKLILGVYHPRAFITDTYLGPSPDTRMYKRLFSQMPSENILFMNEVVRDNHAQWFKNKFEHSSIIPLPVSLPARRTGSVSIDTTKIVSIGRLVQFKNYVLPVIDTLKELNHAGHDFKFYIYGDGPLQKEIEQHIKAQGLEKNVFLCGKIKYSEIYDLLKSAWLFIGMGTSIIEASAYGVPSLQAIESEHKNVTYGFFDQLNGYTVGEHIEGQEVFVMKDNIMALVNASPEQYEAISISHAKRAAQFDIREVMKKYYQFIANADAQFYFRIPRWRVTATKFLRQAFKAKFLIKPGYLHK